MSKIVTFLPLFCETLPQMSWISYLLPSEAEALANLHTCTQTPTPGDPFPFGFYGTGLLFNIPTLL